MFENLLFINGLHIHQDNHTVTQTNVKGYISRLGYQEIWDSGWNGWEGDEKRRGAVKIWQFLPNFSF